MKAFLRWWLLFCLFGIGTGILYSLGLFGDLYDADASKLSFLILTIFTFTTTYIGALSYRKMKSDDEQYTGENVKPKEINTCYFIADSMSTLGMIGTVIGFLMMLGLAFQNLDVTEVTSVQAAITTMALGMSTALVTTLVGMVCSLLIKIQLVNIDEQT